MATVLIAGFHLFLVGGFVAAFALTWWAWGGASVSTAARLTTLTVAVAVGVALVLRRVALAQPPRVGVAVTPDQTPALWEIVTSTATAVGARAPHELRLVPTAGVWVAQDAFFYGLLPGRRTLYVGVPVLQGLTTPQVKALLAHELAHLDRRSDGAFAHQGLVAFATTVATLGPTSITGRLLWTYLWLFRKVFDPIKLDRERAADRAAVEVAGAAATASALREMGPLQAVWDYYLDVFIGARLTTGRAPADILASFPLFLGGGSEEVATARASRADEERPVWDLHPPLADRLESIAAAPSTSDDPRATTLVPDLDAVIARLEPSAMDRGERPQVPFGEFIAHATKVAYRRRADDLFRSAAALAGVRVGRMATVIDLAELGQFGALAASMPGPLAPGTDAMAPLRVAVRKALVLSFVDAGVARFQHAWSGTVSVVGPAEIEHDIDDLVKLIFGLPDEVVIARERLTQLGVDLQIVWSTTGSYPVIPR